jgi:hypothetical protein
MFLLAYGRSTCAELASRVGTKTLPSPEVRVGRAKARGSIVGRHAGTGTRKVFGNRVSPIASASARGSGSGGGRRRHHATALLPLPRETPKCKERRRSRAVPRGCERMPGLKVERTDPGNPRRTFLLPAPRRVTNTQAWPRGRDTAPVAGCRVRPCRGTDRTDDAGHPGELRAPTAANGYIRRVVEIPRRDGGRCVEALAFPARP